MMDIYSLISPIAYAYFLDVKSYNDSPTLLQIYGPGLYTETTFVIAEGLFGDDHIFHVEEINPPPAESRQLTEYVVPPYMLWAPFSLTSSFVDHCFHILIFWVSQSNFFPRHVI